MGFSRYNPFVHIYANKTLGQDKYATVSKLYVKGALGCIIVSDIMNPGSLVGALKWKEVVEDNTDLINGENIPIILLQNKCDAVEGVENKDDYQTMDYLENFSQKNNFKACFQVSAKSGDRLAESVETLLKEVLKQNNFDHTKDNFATSVYSNTSVLKLDRKSVLETNKNTMTNKPYGCC